MPFCRNRVTVRLRDQGPTEISLGWHYCVVALTKLSSRQTSPDGGKRKKKGPLRLSLMKTQDATLQATLGDERD